MSFVSNTLNSGVVPLKGNTMTKKEIHLSVVAAATALCDANKIPETFKTKLVAVLDEHLEPKKGGGAPVNLDEVTRKNEAGQVTEILCQKANVWLPATADFFYEDKSEKGIIGTDGKSLRRLSLQGETVDREHKKAVIASKNAILEDLGSSDLDPAQIPALQAKLKEINESKPDYSVVKPELPKAVEPETPVEA